MPKLLGSHLRGNRDFARMWASLSISELDDRFTSLALPTVASLALHAGSTTVGLLAMSGALPELLFSDDRRRESSRSSPTPSAVSCLAG